MDKILLVVGVLQFNPQLEAQILVIKEELVMPTMMLCSQLSAHLSRKRDSPEVGFCTFVARPYTPPTQEPEVPDYGSAESHTQKQIGSSR